jgi:aminoglycoside/choline kinase family phosphotransferase
VQELLGGRDDGWRLVEEEQLKRHVHRLRFRAGGDERSFVVKRSTPEVARRNRLVATRWLPAIGLDAHGPALLALAPDPATGRVWHVYEDLGRQVLEAENPVRDHVEATVAVLARLHAGFIEHPLLPECRRTGGELGMRFYSSNVRGGIAALRAQALSGLGVPETLLHGDLWTVNVMLVPTAAGLRARLIDWDHAGVGPISYDLSTFLLRFAPEHRRWILEAYRREAERVAGWQLPPDAELDLLFETAEYARFSSVARGRAQAVRSPHAGWAVEGLEWVDGWFEAYEPVLCP